MMKRKMEFLQFRKPMGLTPIKLLWLLEILEISMICPDFKNVLSGHEVFPEVLKCCHDCK
jgi:hypothetical protein